MSHILSGRNKPSLDFVMKVLKRYPEINPSWFLFGEGEMYVSEVREKEQPTLFSADDERQNNEVLLRQNEDAKSKEDCGKKAGTGTFAGFAVLLLSQKFGHIIAGTHTQSKASRLDQRHQRKAHADRTGSTGAQLGNKIGIRRIVDAGGHHRKDGW